MTNLQETVDELRFILQREVIEDRPELWGLVAKYGELCHEANVRLRRCEEFLKQGLRSEAIHLAEQSPALLDVVATLDFAERPQLLDVVDMYFQQPPEPLLLDVAAHLNEAYALQEPLQKLLDQHRLFALARCPLRDRLGVLRKLADLDSATPYWEDDILDMEKARQDEMDAESRTASAAGNVAVLQALASEAQNPTWRSEFPAGLLKSLKSRGSQTSKRKASGRLEELCGELHAAFSALDVASARRCREVWQQAALVAKLPADHPLAVDIAPVMGWLEDQDRHAAEEAAFAAGTAALEQALDRDDASTEELRRLHLPIERLNRSLPELLERRFNNRVRTLETGQARKRKLIATGTVAAAVIVVGSIGLMIRSAQNADQTRRLTAAVEELVAAGNLTEARKMTDAHQSATDELWLTVRKKLSEAEQSEHDRVLKWTAEMESVRAAVDEVQADAPMKQARQLARTEEEKLEVGRWELKWRKRANEATAAREAEFHRRLVTATAAIQALDYKTERELLNDLNGFRNRIEEASTEVSRLKSQQKGVATELASQAGLLESRLTAANKLLTDIIRKSAMLDKLTKVSLIPLDQPWSTVTLDAFPSTLREFVMAYPQDLRTAAFRSAAEACPLPAVYGERDLLKRWMRLEPADDRDIDKRLRELRAFLAEHAGCPGRETLQQYETWLISLQRRFAEDGDPDEGAIKRLTRLFDGKFIRDGHTLTDKSGTTYYLKEEKFIDGNASKVGFDYLVGFNSETKNVSKMPSELTTGQTQSPPQQALAKKVRTEINRAGLQNWNKYFLDLAQAILKADDVDAFLRYLLLLKTLEFAAMGDLFLEQQLEPVLKELNDEQLDRSVAWMDPNNKAAKKARDQAIELLAQLPPLEPLFERAGQREKQFEQALFAGRYAIGWLEKLGAGEWRCRSNRIPADGSQLMIVTRAEAEGRCRWQVLGRVTDKKFDIDQTVAQTAGEACLVFASVLDDTSKAAHLPNRVDGSILGSQ
jgi:hypothetical protein